jgi:Fuc2NAc and GlcNAc transferase
MIATVVLLFALPVSFVLTWFVRRYAVSRQLVDVPNVRSSHTVPTPRGGGMAIVATFLVGISVLWSADLVSSLVAVTLVGAGGLIALIGFLDDHYHLSRRWRLAVHSLAAVWIVWALGGIPVMESVHVPTWLLNLAGGFFLVWLINLYNFMDGIDGIASLEAVTVCFAAVLFYLTVAPGGTAWLVPAVLLASVAGFLFWNLPPARIFMGDAGSGFLGVTLGALSIQAGAIDSKLFWAWMIMLGVFVVDASVTLIRRMGVGAGVYLEPHRSHAYQHAARRLGRHAPVCVAVIAINLFWLLPLAALVATGRLDAFLGLLIAYVPLVALAYRLGAGTREA